MNEKVKVNDIQKFKTLSVKCYRGQRFNVQSFLKRLKITLTLIWSEKLRLPCIFKDWINCFFFIFERPKPLVLHYHPAQASHRYFHIQRASNQPNFALETQDLLNSRFLRQTSINKIDDAKFVTTRPSKKCFLNIVENIFNHLKQDLKK